MAYRWLDNKSSSPPTRKIRWLDDEASPDFSNVEGNPFTGTTGGLTSKYEVPLYERLQNSPALIAERQRQNEQLEQGEVFGNTVTGAGNVLADTTQARLAGLVSAGAGALGTVADIADLPGRLVRGVEEPGTGTPSPVSQALQDVQRASEDIARTEMQEAGRSRQEAISAGASEIGIDFLSALGDFGQQIAAMLLTRSPSTAVGVSAGQVFGPEYARRLEMGMPREEAAMGALARSGIEATTTLPSAGVFGRLLGQGGEEAAGRIVNRLEQTVGGRTTLGAVAEGGQELAANILGQGVDYAIGQADTPFTDVGETFREGGLGAGVGAIIGALSPGRAPRSVRLGIPQADAAAETVARIQQESGLDVPEPPQTPLPATGVATEGETPPEALTQPLTRGERMRARYNLESGQFEPVIEKQLTQEDFEIASETAGMPLYTKRQRQAAVRAGIDVESLLPGTGRFIKRGNKTPSVGDVTQQPQEILEPVQETVEPAVQESETPNILDIPESDRTPEQQREYVRLEAQRDRSVPVVQPVVEPQTEVPEQPSDGRYIRRAMQIANQQGIEATPEWIRQQVDTLKNNSVSEMAVRSGSNPSTLEYYNTVDEIPSEYRNTNPVSEEQATIVNAIKTATNAREAVDSLRPLLKDETLSTFADKVGKYIDLNEIPIRVVNPEDAGTDLGPASYMVAKGKERTVGAYSPTTREVYLKGEGWTDNGMNAEALLHELQHAASVHVYGGVEAGTIQDEGAIKAVEDIKRLAEEFNNNKDSFSQFDQETRDRLKYATINPKEFMAITQTSPLVQQALKKEGLWTRFVNAIRRMFGYTRSETPLLERILTANEKVMEAQRSAQIATAPPVPGTTIDAESIPEGDLTFDEDVSQETPRQAQTKTRSFRNWFGDSKVVNEDGSPKIMYHGTSASGFDTFDTYATNYGLMGQGGYFTDNPEVASSYTSKGRGDSPGVYPVYMSVKNPIDMDKPVTQAERKAWKKAFPDADFESPDYEPPSPRPEGLTNEDFYRIVEESLRDDPTLPMYEGAEIMQSGLRSMGYDGITHIGGGRVRADSIKHRVYIAFEKIQIKSAIGNKGTFSLERFRMDEMSVQRQSTRDRLREEAAEQSSNYYENVPTWAKALKRAYSWTGNKDPQLARNLEKLQLEKASLGVLERDVAKRGDRIRRIAVKKGLDVASVQAQVDGIIRGENISNVDPDILKEARTIRTTVDKLQAELLQALEASGEDPRATDAMLDTIYNSIGSYISRSYQRNYWQPGAIEKSLMRGKEGAAWTKYMKTTYPDIYKNLVRFLDSEVVVDMYKLDMVPDKKLAWMADQFGINHGNLKSNNPNADKSEARARVKTELSTIARSWASPEALRDHLVDTLSSTSADSPLIYARNAARDEGILEKRTDVPQEVRDWWRENTNPIIATAVTVDRVGTLAAETRFLNRVLDQGRGIYVFDENNPAPQGQNLVRLNDKRLGALDGKLVPPELKGFLDAQLGLSELKTSDDVKALVAGIGRNLIVRPGQVGKFMSTVASLPTAAMNVQSNTILAGNDALVMALFNRLSPDERFAGYTPTQLLKASVMDVTRSITNTEQIRKLVSRGILRDTLTLGELRSQTRNLERDLAAEASPNYGTRVARRINRDVQAIGDVMADIYQISDNAPRLIQFSSQLAGLSKAYPDLDVGTLLDMAADRSRNNVPTFGRASPLVRGPSKYLANFATWAGEVVRSYAWRSKYAYDDITRGLREGNQALVTHGIAQAVATGSSIVANYYGTKAIMAGLGWLLGRAIDSDEMESVYERLKNLVPEWLSDKNLVPWEVDRENKRIYVINTSRNDPAAPFQEVANRVGNEGPAGVATYIRDNVLMPGAWIQGIVQAGTGKRRPVESLLKGEKIRDVRDMSEQLRPAIENFVPGTVRQTVKAAQQYDKGADFTTQALRAGGFNVEEIDVVKGIEDRASNYADDKLSISNALRSNLSSPNPMTEEQFKDALADYINDSKELFDQMHQTVQSAKDVVGMENREIVTILKDARGSPNRYERSRLLSGEFRPKTFDSDWLDGVEKRALDRDVRDPSYQEQVKAEFAKRRQWLRSYLSSPSKYNALLEE